MSRVAVVTDSTCHLPPGWARQHGLTVVPVQVIVGSRALDETDADQAEAVLAALRARELVTTSRPTPVSFLHAYRAAVSAGADAIVAITLSSELSATYDSALVAAAEAGVPVEVVDSRSVAMGLGFTALAAARLAARGASMAEVAAAAREFAARVTVLFYVQDLEFLRRGGRIGTARAAIGQVLQVKPLLQIVDGVVTDRENVRTAGRALARLADMVVEAAGDDPIDVAVQHLDAAERAEALAAQLRDRLPGAEVIVGVVGGVVGAHVGPGLIAVVVAPRAEPAKP